VQMLPDASQFGFHRLEIRQAGEIVVEGHGCSNGSLSRRPASAGRP
jgi:hypothetical protein